jgi:hypothetical protein
MEELTQWCMWIYNSKINKLIDGIIHNINSVHARRTRFIDKVIAVIMEV